MLISTIRSIDDVEDESSLRRGSPSAHVKFGLALTINAGNYAYFLALRDIIDLGTKAGGGSVVNEMVRIFTEGMAELHAGQGIEIWWREYRSCPKVTDYLHMLEQSECCSFAFKLPVPYSHC